MGKKTFSVAELVKSVNEVLAASTTSPDVRQGAINVLEHVLHQTQNYDGYRYLRPDEVPEGCKTGIDSNFSLLDRDQRLERYDETRRKYSLKPNINNVK